MSERLGEEVGKAGPSCRTEQEEEDDDTSESGDTCSSHSMLPYHSPFESSQELLAGHDSSMSETIGTSTLQQSFPTLKVKRPGRPRIHPPKPAGISKPRGRPRGSKNKKPRKRRDPTSLTERPPKRPRGRPRKWPPEMWEGFQRSQFAATQHMQQMQRQQQQHSQEMLPGPSHLYYEDHMHSHHEDTQSTVPPPLSHLPYMVTQHETPELSHMMQMPPQAAIPQQQRPPPPHHLHQTLHPLQRHQHEQLQPMQRQDEQMLLIQPLYMQEQERQLREHELMMSQEQQERYYHLEGLHHPPHSTS